MAYRNAFASSRGEDVDFRPPFEGDRHESGWLRSPRSHPMAKSEAGPFRVVSRRLVHSVFAQGAGNSRPCCSAFDICEALRTRARSTGTGARLALSQICTTSVAYPKLERWLPPLSQNWLDLALVPPSGTCGLRPSLCSSSRCRNLQVVVSSGTRALPRSMPANVCIEMIS